MKYKNIFVACDVSSQKEILDLLSKIYEEISGKARMNLFVKR